jgi:hypothetical protein
MAAGRDGRTQKGRRMKVEWQNDRSEAWRLADGTLIVKRRIDQPMNGHDHHFIVDTLNVAERRKGMPSGWAIAITGCFLLIILHFL